MRQGCVVLLSLLLSPAALADCVWPAGGFGSSGLPIEVSNADRRELEHLLGARLDGVACGRISRERPRSFVAKSGFFVLTQDEALFVGDRKVKEILFRTRFVAIRHVSRTTFGSLRLGIATDAGEFRFELPCDVVARGVVDEFERRILIKSQVIAMHPGTRYSCD